VLSTLLTSPSISNILQLQQQLSHFVLAIGIQRNIVLVFDPASGLCFLRRDVLETIFSGNCLIPFFHDSSANSDFSGASINFSARYHALQLRCWEEALKKLEKS